MRVYEKLPKNTKYHLKRVLINKMSYMKGKYGCYLNREYSEFANFICISNNPNDLGPITPSHFLIGHSITPIAAFDLTNTIS